ANGESRADTKIRILCALQKKNLMDFREMYVLFKSIPDVTFSLVPVFQFDGDGGFFKDVVPDAADVARLDGGIDVATAQAARPDEREFYESWKNAARGWLDGGNREPATVHTGSCTVPWFSTYIDAKGRVFPCCYLTETDHVMGNIHERSFKDIWHGQRYQD